jgi:hypothetical protein
MSIGLTFSYAGSEGLDKATDGSTTLSRRFGKTHQISPLRKKLESLRMRDPEPMESYEEWLIKAAQSRADNSPGGDKLSDKPLCCLQPHSGKIAPCGIYFSNR